MEIHNNIYYISDDNYLFNKEYEKIGKVVPKSIDFSENDDNIFYEVVIFDYCIDKYLKNQYQSLLKCEQYEQRTPEWYEARTSLITASDIGKITMKDISTDAKFLLLNKCGFGKPFRGSIATRWGQKYEEVANSIYAYKNNVEVNEFGLIRHPSISFLGIS